MSELSKISETLYVPMGGRIYASENFPEVFYDKKSFGFEKFDSRRNS